MNPRNLFSDPIWQSVGVIVAVLLFIASYIFRRKIRKKLVFTLESNTPLISVDEKLKNDISIEYKGNKVDDVRLIVSSFKNTGNVPIIKSDYEQPIRIFFPYDAQILSVDINNTAPTGLSVVFDRVKSSENSEFYIEFQPALLNPRDQFTISILAVNVEGTISASARITDIFEIENLNATTVTTTEASAIHTFRLWINIFLLFLAFITAPGIFYPNFFHGPILIILPALCGMTGLLLFRLSLEGLTKHPKFGLQLKDLLDSISSNSKIT